MSVQDGGVDCPGATEATAQDLVAPFHPTGTLGAVTLSGVRILPLLIAAVGAIALFTDQLWTVPFVTLLLGVLLGHGLGFEHGRAERIDSSGRGHP